MKKLFILIFALMFALSLPLAADAGAKFNESVGVIGGGVDADLKILPGVGIAGGIGAGGGIAGAQAAGGILWGTAGGNVSVIGGGGASSDAKSFGIFESDWSTYVTLGVGVKSETSAQGQADAHGDVNVKGFLGIAETTIGGAAGEFTADGSYVSNEFLSFSEGKTYGIAAQGAAGAFAGGAAAATFIGSADAKVEAGIHVYGNTYSSSYRATTIGNGYVREELGTNVSAFTNVESYRAVSSPESCLSIGVAGVKGSFVAGGAVTTTTVQTNPNGGAYATATGSYGGSGSLGTNYEGSAVGYSNTSNTVFSGMNGSINSASAGMQVTSRTTR